MSSSRPTVPQQLTMSKGYVYCFDCSVEETMSYGLTCGGKQGCHKKLWTLCPHCSTVIQFKNLIETHLRCGMHTECT